MRRAAGAVRALVASLLATRPAIDLAAALVTSSAAVALLVSAPAGAADAPGTSFWVQYTAAGLAVRGVVPGPDCPVLHVDGVARPMRRRAPSDQGFPVTVCEGALPAGARAAEVLGQALPVPAAHPVRIAVFGDTGCRTPIEDCTGEWGFPALARAVAAEHPDLILHVGDYLYRERLCADMRRCGYGWGAWEADFFAVAAPTLFPAAPLIFVRGNHESCARAGAGWFLLLDAGPWRAECRDDLPAWTVDLGAVNLVVLDTATVAEGEARDVPAWQRRVASLPLAAGRENWLAGHKPVIASDGKGWHNATLQAAFGDRMLPAVTAVLAGHLHLTELIEFAGRPAQLVAGGGGADLARPVPAAQLVGRSAAGAQVTRAWTRTGYGFLLLEEARAGWTVSVVTPEGRRAARCRLLGPSLACEDAAEPAQNSN